MKPSAEPLLDRSKEINQLPEHRFYEAAMRFTVLHGGQSFDTFAVDIFYHTYVTQMFQRQICMVWNRISH